MILSQCDGPMPINKNLWTLSYALVVSGWAMFFFFFIYILVDHWKIWDGTFFYVLGRNSILIYLLSGIIPNQV